MIKTWITFLLLCIGLQVNAQKYLTRNGTVKFESNAEIDDDVRAINKAGACILDANTGEIVFQILIKSFQFKKALMQEHFNENYLESEKYPKSVFKGKIENFESVDLTKPGKYNVVCKGELDLHGVKNMVSQSGVLEVKADQSVQLISAFKIPCADYNIDIPSVVATKIAKEIDVELDFNLKKQ